MHSLRAINMLSKESLAQSPQGGKDSVQGASTVEAGYWKLGESHQRAFIPNRKEMKAGFLSSKLCALLDRLF